MFWPGPFFPIFRQWIPKRCKGVHCVDLGESFPTNIYLQKSASIQPRTSPSKFGEKYSILFTGVLRHDGQVSREVLVAGARSATAPGGGRVFRAGGRASFGDALFWLVSLFNPIHRHSLFPTQVSTFFLFESHKILIKSMYWYFP